MVVLRISLIKALEILRNIRYNMDGKRSKYYVPIHSHSSPNVQSGVSWTLSVQFLIFIVSWTSSQDRFGVLFLFSSPINGTTNPWTTRGFFPSFPLFSHLLPVIFDPDPWEDRKHLLPHGSGGRYRPSEPVEAGPIFFSFLPVFLPTNRCERWLVSLKLFPVWSLLFPGSPSFFLSFFQDIPG